MMARARREPSADMRQAAAGLHELFTALTDEGFSDTQALVILGQMLAVNQHKPEDPS